MWVDLTRPVLAALEGGPKTVKELSRLKIRWLVNCLAWLEGHNYIIHSGGANGTWRLIGDRRNT